MQKVFAHELRGYNRKGEAMATGPKIIRGMFGWWEKLVQNVFGVTSSGTLASSRSSRERKSVGR